MANRKMIDCAGVKVWQACSYLRLSQDEGEGKESNSITSQRSIIAGFVSGRSDICLVGEFVDDGWSGSSFRRPGFQEMLKGLEAGDYNCVICKDLSRFGRNYLETGRYLEREFPRMGVRLIALGDNYDTLDQGGFQGDLMVPFKNLINDYYCAVTSAKTKSSLAARRNKGLFVGSKAPYGYAKDCGDKNALVVDEGEAAVVVCMFDLRLRGNSFGYIARRLNQQGVPGPGMRLGEGHDESTWHANSVMRILSNPTYAGRLAQGRTRTLSFRSGERATLPQTQWCVVDGGCPAIVSAEVYEMVQVVNGERSCARGRAGGHPLCGLVHCGVCGVRARYAYVGRCGRRYGYFRCGCGCSGGGRGSFSRRDGGLLDEVAGLAGCSADREELILRLRRVDIFPDGRVEVVRRMGGTEGFASSGAGAPEAGYSVVTLQDVLEGA